MSGKSASRFVKRSFDLVFSVLGIILLLPLALIVAVLVRIFIGSPVFFKQLRPGWMGKPFTLIKFRTLRQVQGPEEGVGSDAKRMTRLGRVLRAVSLDELPELWNVVRGDMSLVGPRPLLIQYLERYSPEQARRHDVLPGITGWAQVHGRNSISWEEKFKLDVWYVDHWSLGLDLKILLLTIVHVLAPKGVAAPGEVTIREFMGTPNPAQESPAGGERNPR